MKGIGIVTKFIGPTNFRGSRVKATTPGGKSVTISWDYALSSDENHQRAAATAYQRHILTDEHHRDLRPNILMTLYVHGNKAGYVCLVDSISKDKAINYVGGAA